MSSLGPSWVDGLLFVLVVVFAASSLRKTGAPSVQTVAAVLCAAAVIHVLLEGFRWQVVPVYGAIGIAVLSLLIARRWARALLFGLAVMLVGFATLTSWAFPVFELPAPTGRYAIGTTTQFITDTARSEHYTQDDNDKRRLSLRIWYPSDDPESGEPRAYWQQAALRSRAIANGTPFPWFTFTHLNRVSTYAREAAEPAAGTFPVLIYSHGLGIGWASGNTALVEELASQGYIVIAIGHSHISSATIFPDHVAYFDPDTRVAMNTEPPEEVMEIYSTVKDIRDSDKQLEVYMQSMAMMPVSIKGKVDVALETQIEDQQFVLASLPSLRSGAVDLRPHVDAGRVGLFGMSIGGSASILTCSENPQCGAVVNLDGFHPAQAGVELPVPSMALRRSDNLLVNDNFERAQTSAYLVEISDTTHFNYFDFAIISPLLKQMGILGPIDGEEMIGISRDFLTAFFNAHLKEQPSALLEGREAHASEHVTLQRR